MDCSAGGHTCAAGCAHAIGSQTAAARPQQQRGVQKMQRRRLFGRTLVAAALAAAFAGAAQAQEVLKVGLVATLEGPFAAGGQDGMRGAELALKEKNGMAGGR